jgi:hypothetical protein
MRLPVPLDALHNAASNDTTSPTVNASPLLRVTALSCSVMICREAAGSTPDRAMHLLFNLRWIGDQTVESQRGDQRREHRKESEERHPTGEHRHIVASHSP